MRDRIRKDTPDISEEDLEKAVNERMEAPETREEILKRMTAPQIREAILTAQIALYKEMDKMVKGLGGVFEKSRFADGYKMHAEILGHSDTLQKILESAEKDFTDQIVAKLKEAGVDDADIDGLIDKYLNRFREKRPL